MDYIKRVVGVPGDEVSYPTRRSRINGQPCADPSQGDFYDDDSLRYSPMFTEKLGEVEHRILVDPAAGLLGPIPSRSRWHENCRYSAEGVTCKVPAGPLLHDGRQPRQFAGFALLGLRARREHRRRAFFVWMNFGNLGASAPFN
jgi:signal peptidase I